MVTSVDRDECLQSLDEEEDRLVVILIDLHERHNVNSLRRLDGSCCAFAVTFVCFLKQPHLNERVPTGKYSEEEL